MSDDIVLCEAEEGYAFDIDEGEFCFMEARADAGFEVDLGAIAGYDHFGLFTDAGEGHEHLFTCGILGFIEDDKRA